MSILSSDSILTNIGIPADQIRDIIRRYMADFSGKSVAFIGRNSFVDDVCLEFPNITRWPVVQRGDISRYDAAVIVEDHPGASDWPIMQEFVSNGASYLMEALRIPIVLAGARRHLPFNISQGEIVEAYQSDLGQAPWGMDEAVVTLNSVLDLKGRRVLEFGPLDGVQTSALIKAGVAHLDTIEIRPENFAKVAIAKELLGWSQLRLHLDNFHAVTADRYGRYDAVLASGVYYHSNSPFTFLENVCGLSDTILLGGYCATASSPPWGWMELQHNSLTYAVKPYREANHCTAGVSAGAYFFEAEGLQSFFRSKGYRIECLKTCDTASHEGRGGSVVSFIAQKN